ncbi:hypothetical protein FBZ82_1334 [Azospirillum brasilense]|uniref:Uncharacterized protein n=1 Tax=Azospirillum brasilense TaxID=192 RepID=A0A560AE07_AZOBR|nr:hypothetical protein [Azospirillum brasilense]TWA58590.1 hypothetical protein FBZ82_1334 [Azospirillum brasilense]
MIEDDSPTPDALTAANDNAAAGARIDRAAVILARLLGRQMARDAFERLKAANDNRPPDSGGS